LPEVLARPQSIEARGAMLVGSCLSGIAFLKGLGMVHAISHMVGAEFDTHHGLTNAVLLPPVLRFNEPMISDKVGPMCAAMGLKGADFESFIAGVERLLDICEIPRGLTDLGVRAEAAPSLALKASRDVAAGTNPRKASVDEIEALILGAMTTTRPRRALQ
jgi:alcohol dehydrogenase class IV